METPARAAACAGDLSQFHKLAPKGAAKSGLTQIVAVAHFQVDYLFQVLGSVSVPIHCPDDSSLFSEWRQWNWQV